MYFNVTNESKLFETYLQDDIEEQIAGSREERQIMMPLQYITSSKEKAEVEVLFIS
jgi:hypothetical protein